MRVAAERGLTGHPRSIVRKASGGQVPAVSPPRVVAPSIPAGQLCLRLLRIASSLLLVLFIGSPAAAQDNGADLAGAYEREADLLRAEKDALEKRRASQARRFENQLAKQKKSVEDLNRQLTEVQVEAADLEAELGELDAALRRAQPAGAAQGLDGTIGSARQALIRRGVVVPDPSDRAEAIEATMSAAAQAIATCGAVLRAPGTYYGPGGEAIEGEIVSFGRVAAIGISPGASGPLGPVAGGDGLQVAQPVPKASLEQALTGGGTLPVYVFDPGLDMESEEEAAEEPPALEEPAERSLMDLMRSGGPIVWPILILGAIGLLLALERLFAFLRLGGGSGKLAEDVHALVREERWVAAEKRLRGEDTSLARVLRTGVDNADRTPEAREQLLGEAVLVEVGRIERFLPGLRVIAAVAPLLGLLGTVTGMIDTFEVITTAGTGDPQLLSGGISEALITTELGLAVAIPILLLHSLLSSRAERVVDMLEGAALKLSALLPGGSSDQVADERSAEEDSASG